jgi:hypothetical protein
MTNAVRLLSLGLVGVILATSAASIKAVEHKGFDEFSAGE